MATANVRKMAFEAIREEYPPYNNGI